MTSDFSSIVKEAFSEYLNVTPRKLRIIDIFVICCVLSAVIQFFYRLIAGSFPFNSFLSGFFVAIGMAVLAVNLRLQVSNKKEFHNISAYRAFADFVFCAIILFSVVINFIG